MKKTVPTLLLLLALVSQIHTAAADDLFSEVTITSVFGESSKSPSTPATPTTGGRRVSGSQALLNLLKQSGFTTQTVSSNTIAVAIEAPKTKDKILNALIVVRVDENLINLGIPLVQIEESRAATNTLLQLLSQGRNNNAIYFVYSEESKWLGIRRGFPNLNVSAARLTEELNRMATFAQDSVDLWQPLGETLKSVEEQNGTVTTQKQSAPEPGKTETASLDLKGTWSAAGENGRGYGVRFDSTDFELAIVHQGKTSQSKGKWKLTGDRLSLEGDGISVTGTIRRTSSTQFELALPNQAPLKFNRA